MCIINLEMFFDVLLTSIALHTVIVHKMNVAFLQKMEWKFLLVFVAKGLTLMMHVDYQHQIHNALACVEQHARDQ